MNNKYLKKQADNIEDDVTSVLRNLVAEIEQLEDVVDRKDREIEILESKIEELQEQLTELNK